MIPEALVIPYVGFLVFWLGACLGSFLNVCIYRIPMELSVVRPPSHCFTCDAPIAWYDNIPLISYLVLGGRCRRCRAAYSPRYFLVELLTAGLFLLVWLMYRGGPGPLRFDPRIPVYWLMICGLILGTFVDFDHQWLPDRVTKGGMISGVLVSMLVPSLHGQTHWRGGLVASLVGLVLGFGSLWLVARLGRAAFKKDAMGFGDVKLMGAIGAYLGARAVFFTILISSLAGAVVGVSLVLIKGRDWQSKIPYGPYLALAAVLWILWGPAWWDAYIAFLTGRPV